MRSGDHRVGGRGVSPHVFGLVASMKASTSLGGERFGEQVALREVASQATQGRRLGRLFDAFGDGTESEGVGEVDDELAERGVGRSGGETVDEALVDLQDVDRESGGGSSVKSSRCRSHRSRVARPGLSVLAGAARPCRRL